MHARELASGKVAIHNDIVRPGGEEEHGAGDIPDPGESQDALDLSLYREAFKDVGLVFGLREGHPVKGGNQGCGRRSRQAQRRETGAVDDVEGHVGIQSCVKRAGGFEEPATVFPGYCVFEQM